MKDIINLLDRKHIKYTITSGKGNFFRALWEQHFADALSEDTKKDIYFSQYLWHAFSYKKIQCFNNESAIVEFNKVIKQQKPCYIFFQHNEMAFLVDFLSGINYEDLPLYNDIYIMDEEHEWTFVRTHEEQCGPYFYYRHQ